MKISASPFYKHTIYTIANNLFVKFNCLVEKKLSTLLRMSEQKRGSDGRFASKGLRKEIPFEGDVDPDELITHDGDCLKCEAPKTNLRKHYLEVHLGITAKKECSTCSEIVRSDQWRRHLESHSRPARCPHYPTVSLTIAASRAHQQRRHKGTINQLNCG